MRPFVMHGVLEALASCPQSKVTPDRVCRYVKAAEVVSLANTKKDEVRNAKGREDNS